MFADASDEVGAAMEVIRPVVSKREILELDKDENVVCNTKESRPDPFPTFLSSEVLYAIVL